MKRSLTGWRVSSAPLGAWLLSRPEVRLQWRWPMLRSHPLEPAMYVDNKRWPLLHADNMSGHESRQISISLGARLISVVSSYPQRTVSVFKPGLHIVLLF